jgi:hypothetical protein
VKIEFFDAARKLENGGAIPAERFAIPAERVSKSIWNLIQHPRRVMYTPFYPAFSPLLELFFSDLIDQIGPILLRRGNNVSPF